MCLHRDLDVLALHAVRAGELIVDTAFGRITRPGGHRAEIPDKRTGYGRVSVGWPSLRMAMAHRIVWLAAHGMLMPTEVVKHRSRHRWDNALANLYVVDLGGRARPGRLVPYLDCGREAGA